MDACTVTAMGEDFRQLAVITRKEITWDCCWSFVADSCCEVKLCHRVDRRWEKGVEEKVGPAHPFVCLASKLPDRVRSLTRRTANKLYANNRCPVTGLPLTINKPLNLSTRPGSDPSIGTKLTRPIRNKLNHPVRFGSTQNVFWNLFLSLPSFALFLHESWYSSFFCILTVKSTARISIAAFNLYLESNV